MFIILVNLLFYEGIKIISDAVNKKGLEQIISKGSRLFRRTGNVLGKTFTVIAVVTSTYSVAEKYFSYVRNDPNAKMILNLSREKMRLGSAISCIGREAFDERYICTLEKGGAINDLGYKVAISSLSTRYSPDNSKQVFDPNPEKAKNLINGAIDETLKFNDVLGLENSKKIRAEAVKRFKAVDEQLKPEYDPQIDYKPFQKELSSIVRSLESMEWEYNLEISKMISKFKKKKPKYAVEALFYGTIGELLHKKKKAKEKQKEKEE